MLLISIKAYHLTLTDNSDIKYSPLGILNRCVKETYNLQVGNQQNKVLTQNISPEILFITKWESFPLIKTADNECS